MHFEYDQVMAVHKSGKTTIDIDRQETLRRALRFNAMVLCIVAILGLPGCYPPTEPKHTSIRKNPTREAQLSKVAWSDTRVIDGDTLDVSNAGQTHRVRLLCIDTPERDEPGYDEATQALKDLIDDRQVTLQFDPGHDTTDPHGRLLAYVILKDGTNVNVEMVRLRHSYYWTKYGRASKRAWDEAFRDADLEYRKWKFKSGG